MYANSFINLRSFSFSNTTDCFQGAIIKQTCRMLNKDLAPTCVHEYGNHTGIDVSQQLSTGCSRVRVESVLGVYDDGAQSRE